MSDLEKKPPKHCLDVLIDDSLKDFMKGNFYNKDHTLEEYHISVLIGDDLAFSESDESFKFLKKLQNLMNTHSK